MIKIIEKGKYSKLIITVKCPKCNEETHEFRRLGHTNIIQEKLHLIGKDFCVNHWLDIKVIKNV